MTYWQKLGMEFAGELNKCHHCTFQEGMALLPEKSVNLIFADPPYFEVKGEFDFDFEGKTKTERRQNWLNTMIRPLAEASDRVLADGGVVLMYGMDKKIAYQQIVFDEYFELINTLVWEKPGLSNEWDSMRSFVARGQERILYYSREVDQTGLEKVLRHPAFYGLMKYFEEERIKTGLSASALDDLLGIKSSYCYWDKPSTHAYRIPTKEHYQMLQEKTGHFRQEYEALRQEYEALRQEYEALRRPFNNPKKLSDVLRYSQESYITKKYDHPTKKPPTLTRDLLKCTTRKGNVVVIPFSGSGVEAEQCEVLGLDWIAFDIEKKYVDMTNERVEKIRRGKRFDSQKSKTLPIDFGLFGK